MRERYRRWMHDWEARMTTRDNNRVRPFEWGPEWASRWPSLENFPPPQDQSDKAAMLAYWSAANDHIVANSDQFYAYKVPSDFRLEKRKVELFHTGSDAPKKQPKDELGTYLRFTSPVESSYPGNNCMNARHNALFVSTLLLKARLR
jgi:hypothetical protein